MEISSMPAYVSLCTEREIFVKNGKCVYLELINMGFKKEYYQSDGGEDFRFVLRGDFQSYNAYGKIFLNLARIGVVFSGGRGWPPSAIAGLLLDNNILEPELPMLEILWTSPDLWFLQEISRR